MAETESRMRIRVVKKARHLSDGADRHRPSSLEVERQLQDGLTFITYHVVLSAGQMMPVKFPHVCPGDGCAIARYLQQQSAEQRDESHTWPELVAQALERHE